MRVATSCTLALVIGCGTEPRTSRPGEQESDIEVDAGVRRDGSTPSVDAAIVPPDGIPSGLAPCDEAGYHSDFGWIQRTIFDVSCATTGCHAGANPDAGMNLSRGMAYAALVNVASRYTDGWLRVTPGSPGESMLMVQIGGEPGPPLEGLMPWGEAPLCDPQIDAVRRWIQAGALND
jgi:hypothetical protein